MKSYKSRRLFPVPDEILVKARLESKSTPEVTAKLKEAGFEVTLAEVANRLGHLRSVGVQMPAYSTPVKVNELNKLIRETVNKKSSEAE